MLTSEPWRHAVAAVKKRHCVTKAAKRGEMGRAEVLVELVLCSCANYERRCGLESLCKPTQCWSEVVWEI